MRFGRNLRISMTLSVAMLTAGALAPAAHATVCNEASNGQRGDLVATQTPPDSGPAARHQTDLVGLGHGRAQGKGLERAAANSPALTTCGTPSGGGGGGIDISVFGGGGGGGVPLT